MGGRLGGWGVQTNGDEDEDEQELESFMGGVSDMVRPFSEWG
jgi:hypothetical protein